MPEEEIINLGPGFKSRLTWDLLGHDEVQEWLPRLGLVPPSEEGFTMDHVAAHERELRIKPIAPLVAALSSLASDIHASYTISEAEAMLGGLEEEDDDDLCERCAAEAAEADDDDEEPEHVYRMIVEGIITSGALAIISELLQDQVLTIGPGVA